MKIFDDYNDKLKLFKKGLLNNRFLFLQALKDFDYSFFDQLMPNITLKKLSIEQIELDDTNACYISNKINKLEKEIFYKSIISRRMNISFDDFRNSKYSDMQRLIGRYADEKGDLDLNVE